MNTAGSRTIPNEVLLDHISAMLAQGKRVKLHANGDSMRPFIHHGTDVIELVPASELRPGDIVLAKTDSHGYILHRVIRMEGDMIVMAGDGNLYREETCRRRDIIGKAVNLFRNGKIRSLTSRRSRMEARIWRGLLPLRRGMNIIKRIIAR